MANLTNVEGIGKKYAKKITSTTGISTTGKLLEAGKTPKGRKELVKQTGISNTLILKWINRVDLIRVKGVGEEYADLLEVAGVDSVPELAQRNAENLHQKMRDVNAKKKLVRRPPGLATVKKWIAQSKKLPRVVKY